MNTESHINESILSDEIREHQKENRIDHMTYLPDMEDIGSDVMDQVISAMNAYNYDTYTEKDVRRALAHDNRSLEDFKALLSPRPTSPTIVKITAFTVDLTVTITLNGRSSMKRRLRRSLPPSPKRDCRKSSS